MRTTSSLLIVASLAVVTSLWRPAVSVAQDVSRATPPIDPTSFDRSVDACTDFFQFACGGWLAKTEIPADRSRWGRFDEVDERNHGILLQILHKSAESRPDRNAIEQKLGDYFATCLDEQSADAKGSAPLMPDIKQLGSLSSKGDLAAFVAHLHTIGVNAMFDFGSMQDFHDATRMLATADQGGISLPDRDYYLKTDDKSVEIRKQFVAHVTRMLTLFGDPPPAADAHAKMVMTIETELARGSMDVVARRDPSNLYHLQTRPQLEALAPSFAWERYFKVIGVGTLKELNVVSPEFFKGLERLLGSQSLDAWRTYLRWHLLRANAPLLSKAFVDENFAFNGRVLRGQQEQRPREKRCADYVDDDLGELLGQPYVQATFGEEGKKRMLEMVEALQRALAQDINTLPWMTDATRKQALTKLAAIRNKIGYPDRWRDYAGLSIVRGQLVENSWRANTFEFQRQLQKIGRPVDRAEWEITPPTVNAGYNPLMNDITFPAGILQPPFFFRNADDGVNFGAIGAFIGHEITHGFDDFGRQFDAQGNQRDWWTPEDAKEFESRTNCFVDEYSNFTALDELKVNGKLTLGENVADAGGLRIAYMALMDALKGREPAPLDGFSASQRFFLGWAQVWCEEDRPETARLRAQTDEHSPARYRVNGVVSNMPEFAKAFQCKADAPMLRPNMCRVW